MESTDSRLDLVVNGWRNRRYLARRLALAWSILLFVAQECAFSRLLMARDGSVWPPFGLPIAVPIPTIDTNNTCNAECAAVDCGCLIRPTVELPPAGWPSLVGIIVFCILIHTSAKLGAYSARLFYSQPLPADEGIWPAVTMHRFGAGAANDPAGGPPIEYTTGLRYGDVGVHAGTLAELPGSDTAAFIGSIVGRAVVFGSYLRAAVSCLPVFYAESLMPMLPAAMLPDVISFLQ